jgi:hypothetical protein
MTPGPSRQPRPRPAPQPAKDAWHLALKVAVSNAWGPAIADHPVELNHPAIRPRARWRTHHQPFGNPGIGVNCDVGGVVPGAHGGIIQTLSCTAIGRASLFGAVFCDVWHQ